MLKRKPDDSFSGKSAETRARLKAMAKVAERLSSWKPARTELREVRSLETIFVQVDHAVRVGGWPLDRFALVHGPSSHGKTQFVHGLGASFLAAGSYYAYVDAEYTTPASWVRKLLGEFVDYPGFIAHRPRTYEETVSAVRQFCTEIAEARSRGELPEDSTGLVVVDSIRKLNPKKLLDSLLAAEVADGREKKKRGGGRYGKKEASIDGAGGRAGQIKASLNAAWLDELIPLLAHTGTAAAFISRETDDTDVASVFGRDGKDLSDRFRGKVGGGRALIFDGSLVCRVTSAGPTRDVVSREAPVVGEAHTVTVRKTKVSSRRDEYCEGTFHTSNGATVPEGFDRARDVIDLALQLGVAVERGGHYWWGQAKLGHGLGAAVRRLTEEGDLLARLERAVRETDGFVDYSAIPKPEAETRVSKDGARR